MNPARSLSADRRAAVIDRIRRTVQSPGALENTPDDLLLATLHALTGSTGDLVRTVTAAAARVWAG